MKLLISESKDTYDFTIDRSLVCEALTVKDLGVHISNDLTWEVHINKIKSKASQRSYVILKSFQSKNIWILLKAYHTFVRPIVEYGRVVENPYLSKDIESLEDIQRSFTKKICCRCNIPFKSFQDRLYKLNMRSLRYRRMEPILL